jgi:hypothetical protein
MKKLEIKQMEEIQGGDPGRVIGCAAASITLIAAFVGATVATGGIGLAVVATDLILGPTSWGLSCFY